VLLREVLEPFLWTGRWRGLRKKMWLRLLQLRLRASRGALPNGPELADNRPTCGTEATTGLRRAWLIFRGNRDDNVSFHNSSSHDHFLLFVFAKLTISICD